MQLIWMEKYLLLLNIVYIITRFLYNLFYANFHLKRNRTLNKCVTLWVAYFLTNTWFIFTVILLIAPLLNSMSLSTKAAFKYKFFMQNCWDKLIGFPFWNRSINSWAFRGKHSRLAWKVSNISVSLWKRIFECCNLESVEGFSSKFDICSWI